MQSFDPSIKLVRTLKGAPLSILMILRLIGQPATAEYLERTSGYTDKPVNAALLLLEEYGLISRNGRYAWQICAGVQQLPLMNLLDNPSSNENPDSQGEENLSSDADKSSKLEALDSHPVQSRVRTEHAHGTRNLSESELFRVPSSSRSLNLELKDLEVKELPLLEHDPELFRVSENLAACDQADIREPKRSRLSKLPHVSGALIRYHVQTAENIPLAIYRIEKNWRIKAGWVDPAESQNVCAQTFLPEIEKAVIPEDYLVLWNSALESARVKLSRSEFETWVKPAELVRAGPDGWSVRAGNPIAAERIKKNALELLEQAVNAKIEIIW